LLIKFDEIGISIRFKKKKKKKKKKEDEMRRRRPEVCIKKI